MDFFLPVIYFSLIAEYSRKKEEGFTDIFWCLSALAIHNRLHDIGFFSICNFPQPPNSGA